MQNTVHGGPQAAQPVPGYCLMRLLGQGAHGVVHLAEHLASGDAVALKLVPLDTGSHAAQAQAAFLISTDVGRRLLHPGIVRLRAAGVHGALGWLAMEAVPGCDLGRYTHPQRLLPEPVVLQVVHRMAIALAYAHRQGVVHRDLKPANVLVHWPDRTVKLADFGLARTDAATRTVTGVVPGTPAYMAPEQLAGAVPTTHADVYALGVTLFQLLAGRLPHEAAHMGDLLHAVAATPAPDLGVLRPGLPPELTRLVARLLAKRPTDRPSSGEALASELLAAARHLPQAG